MPSTSLFVTLQKGSGRLWSAAQDHPFVHALGDGSLDQDKFAYFLKQDYVFLLAYSRAISLAAAKAPSLIMMAEFTALAHETLSTEMALHREYCAQFGVTPTELEQVEASPICRAYCDFCISSAATMDSAGLLAALVPCAVGYAQIGERLNLNLFDDTTHPYRQWIETYASDGFQEYARWMAATLCSQEALGTSHERLAELQNLFNLGCRYEWLFWEMAWTKQTWPL